MGTTDVYWWNAFLTLPKVAMSSTDTVPSRKEFTIGLIAELTSSSDAPVPIRLNAMSCTCLVIGAALAAYNSKPVTFILPFSDSGQDLIPKYLFLVLVLIQ